MPRIIETSTDASRKEIAATSRKDVPDAVIARQLGGKPEQIREQRQRLSRNCVSVFGRRLSKRRRNLRLGPSTIEARRLRAARLPVDLSQSTRLRTMAHSVANEHERGRQPRTALQSCFVGRSALAGGSVEAHCLGGFLGYRLKFRSGESSVSAHVGNRASRDRRQQSAEDVL
jgi:hypothetical protein